MTLRNDNQEACQTHTRKKLGFWMLTALVIGNVVGSGIFLLPSSLAAFGSISLFAWIFTGLGAICITFVFAKLAGVNAKVGGPYAYCRDAFGDFIGFEVAYNYWLYIWIGNAATVVSLVGYLGFFFPILHQPFFACLAGLIVIWALTLLNIWGVHEAGVLQLVTVILKMIPLLVVVLLGLLFIHPHYFVTSFNVSKQSNLGAFMASSALTLWALVGMESATIPTDDAIEPHKNIPRATILGALVSLALYLIGTIVVMGVLPMSVLVHSTAPFADAANKIVGLVGATIVTLAAICSTLGAVNGWILLQGQIPMAAAKDRLFPKWFAKKNQANSPKNALILSSILMSLLLLMNCHKGLVAEFTFIILLATMSVLLVYFFTCMSELILMIKKPQLFSMKTLLKDIIVCLLASCYIFWAIISSGEQIVFYGTLLFLTGIPIYVWGYWYRFAGKVNISPN